MKRSLPALLLLFSFNSYGALTKWVDSEGKVHYSDEPPPANVQAKTLAVPAAASGVPAEKTYREIEAERQNAMKIKGESEQKAAKQQEEALARQKWCAGMRSNLITLEKSQRIASYNEKGEKILMDDATRQQEIAETRRKIEAECR
jgi:hypothetical protein